MIRLVKIGSLKNHLSQRRRHVIATPFRYGSNRLENQVSLGISAADAADLLLMMLLPLSFRSAIVIPPLHFRALAASRWRARSPPPLRIIISDLTRHCMAMANNLGFFQVWFEMGTEMSTRPSYMREITRGIVAHSFGYRYGRAGNKDRALAFTVTTYGN